MLLTPETPSNRAGKYMGMEDNPIPTPSSPIVCPNCEHEMEEREIQGEIGRFCEHCGYWEVR